MLQTLAPALGLGLEIRFKAAIRPGVRLVWHKKNAKSGDYGKVEISIK
jgi:hypothetical protein